ncbi:unnamed protein product [Parascedosporium putredinis]|uniref:TLC domain-containing protein n=1 Tax=Parascedosporium putredinis TaxID=1442378 RepID=A0A9P1GVS9_9PEZI|nr:unnamed protein product [Parascedosporium putredinis]CAI7988275.1 unnamed protein product [Parascedosporium putredinis]
MATSSRPQAAAATSRADYMNGPLYKQRHNIVLVRRARRKDEGSFRLLARLFIENQIGLAFNLIALLLLAHAFIPKARPVTGKFFTYSYHNPTTGKYGVGYDDGYFITFCIILFTGLRASTMDEQAWLLVYYTIFWPLGLYIYYNSDYWLNLRGLWANWPQRELTGLVKGYVLAQWAFWLQQILVIYMEERRKDHYQMLTHHIITIGLLSSCYFYHHTRVGNLVLVLMDVVDIFLPLAKCLKYTGYTTICDVIFGVFMVSWVFARHIFYLMVCWSIYAHTPEMISGGRICFTSTVMRSFLGSLLALQVLTIMWFLLIVRVAVRVVSGGSADDIRSDDEGENEEEDDAEEEVVEALEEEVGVEDIDLKNWERRAGVKRTATTSGVSLPGHSDRKELLGRIGCEKQVD